MDTAQLIASQWQITHGSTVLLSFNDQLSGEVSFSPQSSGEAAQVAGAAFAVQKTYGNRVNSITFPLVRVFATMAAARAACMALVASLPDGVADAVIESAEGESYTLRGARITAQAPRIEDGKFVACEITLAGGKLDSGEDSTDGLGDTGPLDVRSDSLGDTGDL